VVYSRDHQKVHVSVAYKVKLPQKKPQISHTMMGQYWLGKLSPNKLSAQPEMLSKGCYGILNKYIH